MPDTVVHKRPDPDCIGYIDEKLQPLWRQKLDKWIFMWIYFPSFALMLSLITYTNSRLDNKVNKEEIIHIEKQIDKYEGMELRIVREIQALQDKLSVKIDEIKN